MKRNISWLIALSILFAMLIPTAPAAAAGDAGNGIETSGLQFDANGRLVPSAYDKVPTFENGKTPQREIYVGVNGNDATGDGTIDNPYNSVNKAVEVIKNYESGPAGSAIRILPGLYYNRSIYVEYLNGTEDNPIWIGGVPGMERPVIMRDNGTAFSLRSSSYIILHDMELTNNESLNRYYCINVDDSARGMTDTDYNAGDPQGIAEDYNKVVTHHLVLRGIYAHSCGDSPVKLTGIRHFWFFDNEVSHGFITSRGSANIDQVGCHYGVLAYNYVHDSNDNGIGFKGGSSNSKVYNNLIVNVGNEGIAIGQNTGKYLMRPFLVRNGTMNEASYIEAYSNIIIGGMDGIAFDGGVFSKAVNNTIILPERSAFRFLRNGGDGLPNVLRFDGHAAGNVVANNIVYYKTYMYDRTEPVRMDMWNYPNQQSGRQIFPLDSFDKANILANNLFYNADDPSHIMNNFARFVSEGNITGQDPLFVGGAAVIANLAIPNSTPVLSKNTQNVAMIESLLSLAEGSPAAGGGTNGGAFTLEIPSYDIADIGTVPAESVGVNLDLAFAGEDFAKKPFASNRSLGAIQYSGYVEPLKAMVSFYSDGVPYLEMQVERGGIIAAPADPVKEGHKFIGWYSESGLFDFSLQITADIMLTSKWAKLESAAPSAFVQKLSGNKNALTITVTEVYEDGSEEKITQTFSIDNNAADTYVIGKYKVYVNTKGNVQVRECRFAD